jgi:hypothetical protein
LTETPDAPNTIMVANSLTFPMVHKMAPNGQRFVSYGSRKPDRLLTQNFLGSLDLPVGLLAKFCHDHPRNFVYEKCHQQTKLSAGYSYDWFGHMVWWLWIFKSGFIIGQILDRLVIQVLGQVFWPQDEWDLPGSTYKIWRPLAQLSDTYSNTHFRRPQPRLWPFRYSHMWSYWFAAE